MEQIEFQINKFCPECGIITILNDESINDCIGIDDNIYCYWCAKEVKKEKLKKIWGKKHIKTIKIIKNILNFKEDTKHE